MSKRNVFIPSEEDKRKGLIVISKEIELLHFNYNLIAVIPDCVLRYSLLESLLIHVRNLYVFLTRFPRNRKHKDILAHDWTNKIYEIYYKDDKTWEKLNKCLAHIDYHRTEITTNEKKWNLDILLRPIFDNCNAFFAEVENITPNSLAEIKRQNHKTRFDIPSLDVTVITK